MAEYIDREALIGRLTRNLNACNPGTFSELCYQDAINTVNFFPASDVVSESAYKQIMWERDLAIQQLRSDYGVGLGEKKNADVAPVVHGKWAPSEGNPGFLVCSACGDCYVVDEWADGKKWMYCPNCGAKMDGKDEDT